VIGGRRPLQGRKLGDKRVRVERHHAAYFRWTGKGQLTAKESASSPTTAPGRAWARVKALSIGRPLASAEEIGERLSKKKLAIFSSDAISSSAYLDVLDLAWPPDKPAPITMVVLPEYVARHWWDRLLYNQSAKRLKAAFVGREHTVIAGVPFRRSGN
jgi:hypothetical protein